MEPGEIEPLINETEIQKLVDEFLENRNKPYSCDHKWKTTMMVFNSITFCEHCGEKK